MEHEIVAILTHKGIVTNDLKMVLDAMRHDQVKDYLSRQRMQFMAMFDLGPRWKRLAESETLFIIDTDDSDTIVGVRRW